MLSTLINNSQYVTAPYTVHNTFHNEAHTHVTVSKVNISKSSMASSSLKVEPPSWCAASSAFDGEELDSGAIVWTSSTTSESSSGLIVAERLYESVSLKCFQKKIKRVCEAAHFQLNMFNINIVAVEHIQTLRDQVKGWVYTHQVSVDVPFTMSSAASASHLQSVSGDAHFASSSRKRASSRTSISSRCASMLTSRSGVSIERVVVAFSFTAAAFAFKASKILLELAFLCSDVASYVTEYM